MVQASAEVTDTTLSQWEGAGGMAALQQAILLGGTPELFLWGKEGDVYLLVSLGGDGAFRLVRLDDGV